MKEATSLVNNVTEKVLASGTVTLFRGGLLAMMAGPASIAVGGVPSDWLSWFMWPIWLMFMLGIGLMGYAAVTGGNILVKGRVDSASEDISPSA